MKQKRYYVYPYLITLCWFGVALILVGGTVCALSTGDWLMPFCILSPVPPTLLLAIWGEGYSAGWITLDENAISLHALFRLTLTIPWDEIRHAGFGSSSTEILLFDWIYLGHEPMPLAYQHQMHRLRCTPSAIRFQYQEDLFQLILPRLNKQTRTMLEAGMRHMEEQQSGQT